MKPLFDFSLEDVTLKIFLTIFEMDEDFWSSWNVLQDRNLYVYINVITLYWRHNVITVACYQLISPINKGLWKQYCLGVWTSSIFIWNWGNTTAVPYIRQESFAGVVCKIKMLDFVVCIFISTVKWKKAETWFILIFGALAVIQKLCISRHLYQTEQNVMCRIRIFC